MSEYKKEEAVQEASEIQELAGKKAGEEDYYLAEAMLMDEKSAGKKERYDSLAKGRITVIPPEYDKYTMIRLDTLDKEEFRLFNMAARNVTEQYGGFNQIGGGNESGDTAWELWKLPKDVLPYQVVREIEAKMAEYKKLGW